MAKERIEKRKEEISTQIRTLHNTKSTDPYRADKNKVSDNLEALDSEIREYSTPEGKKLSYELQLLSSTYKSAIGSIDDLLNKLNKYNENIDKKYRENQKVTSKEAKQYKANIDEINKYDKLAKKLSKDLSAINKAIKKNEPVTLKSIYEKSRVNSDYKIKEGTKVEKFGAWQNSRLKMTIVDKNGNEKVGYFTADNALDLDMEEDKKKTFKERKAAYGSFAPKISYDKMNEIFGYMTQNQQVIEDILMDKRKYMDLNYDSFIEAFNTKKTPEGSNMVRRYVKDPSQQKAFLDMFSALAEGMNRHSVKMVGGINEKARLNRRNAAMSTVADYLGCKELLAESENIKITIDGKAVKGTFMADSNATDSRKLTPSNELLLCTSESIENLNLKKHLADLQVLDYICGNYDRHDGNMHYKCEMQDKMMIIKDVIGIDNDNCMGSEKDYGNVGMSAVTPDQMVVITKSMAQKIKSMDMTTIKEMLYGYDIQGKELDAMADRLETLKKKIDADETFYSKGYGKGTVVNNRLKVVDDDELDIISFDKLCKDNNIFSTVKDISDTDHEYSFFKQEMKKNIHSSAWDMTNNLLGDFNRSVEKLINDDKWVYNSSEQYNNMKNKTKDLYESMATISGPVVLSEQGTFKLSKGYTQIKQQINEAIQACKDYRTYKHDRNQREHKIDFDERPHKLSTAEKRWEDSLKTQALLEKQLEAFQKFENDFEKYKINEAALPQIKKKGKSAKMAARLHPNKTARELKDAEIEYNNDVSRAIFRLKKEYYQYKNAQKAGNNNEAVKHELKYGCMLGYALTAFHENETNMIREEMQKFTGHDITKSNEELFKEGCAKELIHAKMFGDNSQENKAILNNINTNIDNPVASLMKEDSFKEYMKGQERAFSTKGKATTLPRKCCMHELGEYRDQDVPTTTHLSSRIKNFGEKVLEASQKNAKKSNENVPGKK